jgi:hypothetical protein
MHLVSVHSSKFAHGPGRLPVDTSVLPSRMLLTCLTVFAELIGSRGGPQRMTRHLSRGLLSEVQLSKDTEVRVGERQVILECES